jgi:hypothetical protein
MNNLRKVLVFSVVAESTFALLYFAHADTVVLGLFGLPQSSFYDFVNRISMDFYKLFQLPGLQRLATLALSNPTILGIAWSIGNAALLAGVIVRSFRTKF